MAMRSGHVLLALALLSSPALAQKKPVAKTPAKAAKPVPKVDPAAAAAHFSLDLSPSEDPPPPVTLNPPSGTDAATTDAPVVPSPDTASPTPAPEVHASAHGMTTTDLPPSDVAQPSAAAASPAAEPPVPSSDALPASIGKTPAAAEAALPAADAGAPPEAAAADKPVDATPASDTPPKDAASPAAGEPFQPPPPTFMTLPSATKLSVDTPIVDLIADPQAKAVLDKDLPGLSDDKNLDKFKYLTLRGFQPMTGGQLTDDMLKTVDGDLAAIGKPAPAAKKRKFDSR